MAGGCDLPLRRRPPQPRRPQPPLPARQRLPRREAWQAAVVATRLGVGGGVGGGRGGAGGQTFSVWAAAGNVRGLGRLGWGTVVRRACVCRARLKSRIGQTTAKRGTLAALPSHVTACAWAARASRAAHRAHRRVPSAAVGELSATHTPPPPLPHIIPHSWAVLQRRSCFAFVFPAGGSQGRPLKRGSDGWRRWCGEGGGEGGRSLPAPR